MNSWSNSFYWFFKIKLTCKSVQFASLTTQPYDDLCNIARNVDRLIKRYDICVWWNEHHIKSYLIKLFFHVLCCDGGVHTYLLHTRFTFCVYIIFAHSWMYFCVHFVEHWILGPRESGQCGSGKHWKTAYNTVRRVKWNDALRTVIERWPANERSLSISLFVYAILVCSALSSLSFETDMNVLYAIYLIRFASPFLICHSKHVNAKCRTPVEQPNFYFSVSLAKGILESSHKLNT